MPAKDLKWLLQNGRLRLTATPTLYRCEPIWSWSLDSLPDYALLLTLDGRGTIKVDQITHPLRQGLCLILRPTSSIEAQQTPSYPLFLFIARFEILDTSDEVIPPAQIETPQHGIFMQNTRHLETLAELIADRCDNDKGKDKLTEEAIDMLLRLVVESATNNSGNFHPQTYEALRAIENDLARKWTVAELAQEAQLPPGAFARSFAAMMNEPPIHYVIRRRMEEAKRQVQQSSLPIEEIAINLGYTDLHFFRELFRKRVGHSPEDLRVGRVF